MSELTPLYPCDVSEALNTDDTPPAVDPLYLRSQWDQATRAVLQQPKLVPNTDSELPTLASAGDRRVQHNNALRSVVIMGDLLAARLREKTAETVDFRSEGLILAWQHAVEHLRRFGK